MTLTRKPGANKSHKVEFYGLSTCGWCRRAKEFLDQNGIEYDYIYVDETQGDDRAAVTARVRELNPRGSYPTIQVDGRVCVGFDEEELREFLGL
jgi:glutaredoxin